MLEKQGKTQQAITLTAKAFNDSLQGQTREVGYLSAAWEGATNWLSKYWDKAKSIGAGKTDEERMRDAAKEVERLSANIPKNFSKEAKENLRKAMLEYDSYAQLVAQKQKEINKTQEDSEKLNEYKRAGGLDRTLSLEFKAKENAINDEINLRMVGATELQRVELEGERKILLSRLELQKRFRDVGYGLEKQEREAQAAEEVRIKSEVEQKKSQITRQAYEEFKKAQQLRANEVELEREKLEVYQRTLFLSEADAEIAVRRLKTEQEIAKILANPKLDKSQQDQAVEREKQIGKASEDVARYGESLKVLKDINQSVFSNMGSAIDNFVRTGKFAFKDFARSVIQDILSIALRAQATKILSAGLSGFGGLNIGTALQFGTNIGSEQTAMLAAQQFADGGSPPVGVASLVGERGPELFIPRTAGTIIPNEKLNTAMGGVTNVTNNYIDAIDTKSFEDRILGSHNAVWAANQYANKSLPLSRGRA